MLRFEQRTDACGPVGCVTPLGYVVCNACAARYDVAGNTCGSSAFGPEDTCQQCGRPMASAPRALVTREVPIEYVTCKIF